MNALKAIQERRSIKHFDPSHTMDESEIQTLMEHTLLSPTSFNMQNWRFILVTDSERKERIKNAAWGQSQIADASLTIVLCADLHAHEQAERYWAKAPKNAQEMIIPMIHQFYEDKPQLQHDEAVRSIGIAGQTIMLAAKAMDYDSCPMIGFDPQKVAEIIQLPENHIIGMIIPVGKALKPAGPRSGPMPMNEICFKEHF
jgi:nitroreductase